MSTPREIMKEAIGSSSKLRDIEVDIIIALNNLPSQNPLDFAKKMERGINNFSLNEQLLAEELAKQNDTCKAFMEYTIYCLFEEMTDCLKTSRYDLRNESALKNARMLLAVWNNDYPNNNSYDKLNKELLHEAKETAKYWSIYMHRTLQQTLVRVLINYIHSLADESSVFKTLSEVNCIGMAFI